MRHLGKPRLEELALGAVQGAERASALEHLRACASCAGTVRALRQAWGSVGLTAEPARPSPELRTRVLGAIGAPGLLGFADLLARSFDLSLSEASALLTAAEDDGAWQPGPAPGLEVRPFRPGPRRAEAEAGLFRGAQGAIFPRHAHLGRELVVVLRGGLVTDAGAERWPGATLVSEPGSSHDFRCGPDGCLAAVLVFDGIDVEGRGPARVRRRSR